MKPVQPTVPNIMRGVLAFLALAVLFAACPPLAVLITIGLWFVPIRSKD